MRALHPKPLLDRYEQVYMPDKDVAQEAVMQLYGDVTLAIVGARRRFAWNAGFIDLGPLAFILSDLLGSFMLSGAPAGYVVCMSVQGVLQASDARRSVDIMSGRSAAVFSPVQRGEFRAQECRNIALRFDPRSLEATLEALTGEPVRRPIEFELGFRTDAGLGAGLERLCLHLLGELERGSRVLDEPLVVASLCDALMRALLLGQHHEHSRRLRRAPPSGRSSVRLIEEYLDAHAAEPVRMADLTQLAGVSVLAIEAAFRAHRGTTPAAFLRSKRLEIARRKLLLGEPDATPAHVARAAGYLDRRSFERDYAQKFGESPAETRARGLIAAGQPPSSTSPRAEEEERLTEAPLEVFLVNDDRAMREGMRRVLEPAGHTVREFDSAPAFLAAAASARTGCVVLDLHPPGVDGGPGVDGSKLMGVLRGLGCTLPVIFTSEGEDARAVVAAMKGGALDVLLTPIDPAALLAAVESALACDAAARAAQAERAELAARLAKLSRRELEVCQCVAAGMLNKQIAAELGISEATVKQHRARGLERLGVASVAALAELLERARRAGA